MGSQIIKSVHIDSRVCVIHQCHKIRGPYYIYACGTKSAYGWLPLPAFLVTVVLWLLYRPYLRIVRLIDFA